MRTEENDEHSVHMTAVDPTLHTYQTAFQKDHSANMGTLIP